MQNSSKIINNEDNYFAFISYSHTNNRDDDRKWASWLHSQLETYEIPAELIKTNNSTGEEIPESIYPIFRDELSLPADASLKDSISHALNSSRYLIVLCSPQAVASRYVNEEILHFKRNGGSTRIIAAIIEGEPLNSSDPAESKSNIAECFPESLRFEIDENGQLDRTRPSEPIAADFRLIDGTQGFTNPNTYRRQLEQSGINSKKARIQTDAYEQRLHNARLKIISGILGVSLERLTKRDKAYQLVKARAAAKRFRRIAVVMAVLALSAASAGLYAYNQFKRAESTLSDLRSNLSFMNVDLRMLLTSYVPSEQRSPVIKQIDTVIESLQRNDTENDADRHQFAAALKHKADELRPNDPGKALEMYLQVIAIHRKLLEKFPNDAKRKHNLSVSLVELGDFHLDRSELDLALRHYQEATTLRQSLLAQEPDNRFWHRELSTSLNRESIVFQKQGKFEKALEQLQYSLKIAEENHALKADDNQSIRDLYIAWNLIGNTEQLAGNLPGALNAFKEGIKINRQVYEQDRSNLNFKRDLSVSYTNLGDVFIELGKTTEAIQQYQEGLKLATEMLIISPKHPMLLTDLAGNYIGLGRALELKDPVKALSHLHQARDLINPLLENGPLDDDRKDFPTIIDEAIRRLEDATR